MRAAKLCLLFLAICYCLTACRRHPTTNTETDVEPYAPTDGAVGLNVLPVQSDQGSRAWLATYTDEGGTTKFTVELGATHETGKGSMPFGQGRFISEAGSDPLPLMRSLKQALQAKRMPANGLKVESLPFDYFVLGEKQTRSAYGSFSGSPKGNWTTLKIFLPQGGDDGEVYFNIDPSAHQAEFAIKDSQYGNYVLTQLAKIF